LAPVISYLQLGGRCRYCGVRLSPLYPLGELAAGLAVGLSLARFGVSPQALACMVFCLALVVIALVDARAGIVPDLVVLPATAAALLASFRLPEPGFLRAVMGGLLIAGGLWAVARLYRALRGREGLGMGDVKLAGLMGAYLGPGAAGLAVSLAAGAGLIFYLGAWTAGRAAWDARLPFAPFLALGGAAMALAGGDVIHFLYGV
jgi:leader peptidase (prepilin peptidase)/N-methyltransferase